MASMAGHVDIVRITLQRGEKVDVATKVRRKKKKINLKLFKTYTHTQTGRIYSITFSYRESTRSSN